MRFAPCVLLPSSLMYFLISNSSNWEFVQLALYICVIIVMFLVGSFIYGDRLLSEFVDQPIVLFLFPFLMVTFLWSIRRGHQVKHVTTKPPKPKQKPLKEAEIFSSNPSSPESSSDSDMQISSDTTDDSGIGGIGKKKKGRNKKKRQAQTINSISTSSSSEDLAANSVKNSEKGINSVERSAPSVKKKAKKKKMHCFKENLDPKVDGCKDKMIPILPPYLDVQNHPLFKNKDLYDEFEKYLLTPEQLARNDYPLENPENPGHIVTRIQTYHPSPTARICSRCGKSFHIENDQYSSDTNCFYHTDVNAKSTYACCGQQLSDLGCKLGYSHVNPALPLDELIFKKTELKKQVKADQLRKVFGLDCEMVYTTLGFEVAKVTLVDVQGKPVYDTLVRPQHPVTDYNTVYSGISKKDLKDVNITFHDVQAFLLKTITKDTILVGHALQNDLKCLRIIHEKVVDTQVVFRQPGDKCRKKLKALAKLYLNQTIQDSKKGHCSLQDARACMELMLKKIYSALDAPLIKERQEQEKNIVVQTVTQVEPAKQVAPVPQLSISEILNEEYEPVGLLLEGNMDFVTLVPNYPYPPSQISSSTLRYSTRINRGYYFDPKTNAMYETPHRYDSIPAPCFSTHPDVTVRPFLYCREYSSANNSKHYPRMNM